MSDYHLKRGANGHLLHNAAGHLVNDCGGDAGDCVDTSIAVSAFGGVYCCPGCPMGPELTSLAGRLLGKNGGACWYTGLVFDGSRDGIQRTFPDPWHLDVMWMGTSWRMTVADSCYNVVWMGVRNDRDVHGTYTRTGGCDTRAEMGVL